MSIAYLNGEFLPLHEAKISPLDRGFMFADGVYEVIPVYAGVPFRLPDHLRRLQYSLGEIQLPSPLTQEQWEALCHEMVDLNGGGNLSLYLQITRGTPVQRDHTFPELTTKATVFAMATPLTIPTQAPTNPQGESAITLEDLRWARCDIKAIALLPNILMRQQAADAGAAEAILLRNGYATEGAASNLFIVQENVIITPPLSHHILGGITRDVVIELCQQHGLNVQEKPIPKAQLQQAEEIWITSSTREVVPIVTLDGSPIGHGVPGPLWRQVASLYTQLRRQLCGLEPL